MRLFAVCAIASILSFPACTQERLTDASHALETQECAVAIAAIEGNNYLIVNREYAGVLHVDPQLRPGTEIWSESRDDRSSSDCSEAFAQVGYSTADAWRPAIGHTLVTLSRPFDTGDGLMEVLIITYTNETAASFSRMLMRYESEAWVVSEDQLLLIS